MANAIEPEVLTQALRRDRLLVAAGLVAVAFLAWLYVIGTGRALQGGMGMTSVAGSGVAELGWLIPMWIVMMVAMMIPSAAPAILLFANVAHQRRSQGLATASASVFTLGYLLAWAFYGTIAAMVQWLLHREALLSPTMASASPLLGGGLLVLAGVYQLLPSKGACLAHCRSPLRFFSSHWREGVSGALKMGLHHGTYCVGCCWALMTLLFVAGIMNLLWVAAIALFVLAEKLTPVGPRVGRYAGVALIVWGLSVLARA